MPGQIVEDLRKKTAAALANLTRQLRGMEPHLERSDAPGEWTTREVLSHLTGQPGWDPATVLGQFSERDLPVVDVVPSMPHLTDERRRMSLKQFTDAIEDQHRRVFAYLDRLPESDLERRKARIPFFKQFMGTDEIPMSSYVGALFDYHWNDHAGQLAKIRKATGLPAA